MDKTNSRLRLVRTQFKQNIPNYIKEQLKKSSKNVALSRDMVNYTLNDDFSLKLQTIFQDSKIPDELFYGTLAYHLGIESVPTDQFCYRFSMWRSDYCKGRTIRGVCNFAIEDLEELRKTNCLSANKFNIDVNSAAILCQAKNILNDLHN